MAKHVISEAYSFTPASRTIVITGKSLRREQLLLITNVTTNTVIYNFSDTSLTASTYTVSTTNNVETTTIILTYNTSSMSSTDKLAILYEETNELMMPAEAYRDPVEKFRISAPQALIDTDFEYGTQSTKWETIALNNNRPSAFYDQTQGISNIAASYSLNGGALTSYQLTAIAGNGTRLVTITFAANANVGISASTPIYVQDSTDQVANGWYIPFSVSATQITYYARGNVTNGNIFDPTKTYLFVGNWYTGAALPAATTAFTYAANIVTVTTTHAHGLTVGQGIFIVGTTAATNPPNGSYYVRRTPTSNTFDFDTTGATGTPTGTITALLNASVYTRTWGGSQHRAFDGGVTFSAGYPFHGNQLIRQTRRYFRYQSGKGIQFSTGANFCTPLQVDGLTAVGATVTVTTKFVHNLNVGAVIRVAGADQAGYNGTWTVTSIPTDTTFTYTAGSSPASPATSAVGGYVVQPYTWYGAFVRVGMFDSQNGLFFEYDGQTLWAVRRSSTLQLPGYLSTLANGSQVCTGINTKWSESLIPGDFVVIRGLTFTIVSIESNTSMTIYPDYRGVSITAPSQVIVSKIVDTRYAQSTWNIDKVDGTGASLFNLDITKMQMWFIDYAWYGAGTVRWGIRNQRGEVIYCHRLPHGNATTEAYMRSGNLPARYEVNTFFPKTIATASIGASDTTITVRDTSGFPPSGTFIITGSGNTAANIEYVNYTAKTATQFTGCTRGQVALVGPGATSGMGGQATGQAFTFSATAPISIAHWGSQAAITISHWGSSVIMDGRYDDDKSFQFNYGLTTPFSAATISTRYPVFSIRLAPTVDSGLTGIIGQREIINRMQLQPAGIGVFCTPAAGVRVEVWLNARVTGVSTFASIGGSSLAQFALHANTQALNGGECIFTFIAPAGGVSSQDLTKLRDIGNSILGGGTTNTHPTTDLNKYPDGPDILTVAVIPLAASAVVTPRLSWFEAQA